MPDSQIEAITGKDYALVVVSILTNAVTSFAAPIGINGIL